MCRLTSCARVLAAAMIIAVAGHASAETFIQFDYTYDSGNFFGPGTTARASLEAAGDFYEGILRDDLAAITPGGSNTWRASFTDPNTGDPASIFNSSIPADTLLVYVGARDLDGTALGQAGPGGWSASGSPAWRETVRSRGEGTTQGPGADDFGPWGGSLAVDVDTTWNLDHTVAPSGGRSDLYSVILHELGHVLGFGIADSWNNWVSGLDFTGPASVAEYGANVPLDTDLAHWAAGTKSQVYPNGAIQEAAMDPDLTVGTRKLFTRLDVAALDDIGWEIVPEPSIFVLGITGLLALLAYRYRKAFAS
jgi:hypothetical protein